MSLTRWRESRRTEALYGAVRALPLEACAAMLDALEHDELIVGGYADRRGRACPMLAAHRRGVRTDVGMFPRAWDAFARARRPRIATDRELAILRALLQESVAGGSTAAPGAATRATRSSRVPVG